MDSWREDLQAWYSVSQLGIGLALAGMKISDMSALKRPDFFKVYLPNYSSERLKIPIGFVQYMEGRTSGPTSLTGPSQNVWQVELVQKEDCFFFEEGWPAFVKDHRIEIGEFLHFHYDGDLSFTVAIFDRSACEKESAFLANCSQPKAKASASSRFLTKMCGENQGCLETDEERAKPFTSRHPSFAVQIKPYHISGSNIMHIPMKFRKEHNLKYKSYDEIVLKNQKGESWSANIICVRNNCTLCRGWRLFVYSNNIKTGDNCIFELVDKFEMHVHINRI